MPRWIKEARGLLGERGVIWANIIPDGKFLQNSAIWQRNQYDDDFPQLCIANPTSQAVLSDFMLEIFELGVDGITFDITDLTPNTGSEGRAGIVAQCFCDHCRSALQRLGFAAPLETFVGEEHLLKFMLQNSDTGTSHIDPPDAWIREQNVRGLIAIARDRNFISGDDADLEKRCELLYRYLDARTKATALAIREITKTCRDSNIRSAVILNSIACDLSQGTTLESLIRVQSAGEYWIPDAPTNNSEISGSTLIQFLGQRSTYYDNNFFETLESASNLVLAFGVNSFIDILLRRSKAMLDRPLSPGAAFVQSKLVAFSGFAGIPLGQDDHLQLIETLTTEVTGQVLPRTLLEKFRITASTAE